MNKIVLPEDKRIQIPLEVSRNVLFKLSMNTGDFYKPLLQELYKLKDVGVPYEKIEQGASDVTVVMMWAHSQIAEILFNLLLEGKDTEEKAS